MMRFGPVMALHNDTSTSVWEVHGYTNSQWEHSRGRARDEGEVQDDLPDDRTNLRVEMEQRAL